jgi:tetratricopeptide (TPR) repeat protein
MSTDVSVELPKNDALTEAYSRALAQFVDREIGAEAEKLKDEIKRSRNDPKLSNKLGVLYARYGMYENAAAEFEKIIAGREFVPALVNRGNIYYLKKEWVNALAMYERGYKQDEGDVSVILSIAKVKYEMDDFKAAKEYYTLLETNDLFLAKKYAYLVMEVGKDESRAVTNVLAARAAWME